MFIVVEKGFYSLKLYEWILGLKEINFGAPLNVYSFLKRKCKEITHKNKIYSALKLIREWENWLKSFIHLELKMVLLTSTVYLNDNVKKKI